MTRTPARRHRRVLGGPNRAKFDRGPESGSPQEGARKGKGSAQEGAMQGAAGLRTASRPPPAASGLQATGYDSPPQIVCQSMCLAPPSDASGSIEILAQCQSIPLFPRDFMPMARKGHSGWAPAVVGMACRCSADQPGGRTAPARATGCSPLHQSTSTGRPTPSLTAKSFAQSMLTRLLVLAATVFGLSAPAGAQDPVDSAAYLLVIDHSGSMNDQDTPTASRWETMVDRAVGFLRDAPLESLVWIAVFDAPASDMVVTERVLNSDDDRNSLIGFIQGQPKPNGGTALYDTLYEAFTRAQGLSEKTPGRYVSVMVYSDGVDRDSRRSQDDLQNVFDKLVAANGNIWCFLTPLVDGLEPALDPGGNIQVGTPKRPVPVRLAPSSLQLSTPAAGPVEFELELMVPPGSSKNFPAGAVLEWDGDFDAVIEPSVIPLEPGAVNLELKPVDGQALDPQVVYGGALRVRWPDAPKQVLLGPDSVRIDFQMAERPRIEIISPSDGAVLASGRDYVFEVRTLQGAEVRWAFDEAGTMTSVGARVLHSYPGPGKSTVTIAVRDPGTGLENEASFQVEVIDVVVGIDVPSGQIFAGQPFTFTSSQRGGIMGYDWVVDGRTYVGKSDGSFTHTFARPGAMTILVKGTHPKVRVESEPLEVTVQEAPSLVVIEPQQGGEVPAEALIEFVAAATGPAQEVVWRLVDPMDGSVLRPDTAVPLVLDPGSGTRRSVLRQKFSETGPTAVRVEIEADPGLSAAAEVKVVPPLRTMRMVRPTAGRDLFAGEVAPFLVEVEGAGIREVRWEVRLEGQAAPSLMGVSEIDNGGVSAWEPVLETPRDTRVSVIATAILESGAPGPRVERTYALKYPEVSARLSVSGGARYDDPVLFRVSGDDLEQVIWDFGDGQRETTASFENQHVYAAHGRFAATIEVVGAGGKRRTFEHLVDIATTTPTAIGRLVMEGDEEASPAPDQTLHLENASTGDVVSATWILDGEPLSPEQRTLVFDDDQRGSHVLILTVTGPPGAGGEPAVTDSTRIEFRVVRYDHALFAVGVLIAGLALGLASKLLLGNGPSRWKYVGVYPFTEEPDDSDVEYSLRSRWSRWSGVAVIKFKDLHLGVDSDKAGHRTMIVRPKHGASERSTFADVTYSHSNPNPEVSGVEVVHGTHFETYWRFWDHNFETMPSGEPWGLRILRPARVGKHLPADLGLLTFVLAVTAAGLYLLYQHVYLSF